MPDERRQGLVADVMLDPLGVGFGDNRIDAQRDQEIPHHPVALAAERGKLLAWRHGLREVMRQSPLCDEERFVDDFQTMLEQVAELHGLR